MHPLILSLALSSATWYTVWHPYNCSITALLDLNLKHTQHCCNLRGEEQYNSLCDNYVTVISQELLVASLSAHFGCFFQKKKLTSSRVLEAHLKEPGMSVQQCYSIAAQKQLFAFISSRPLLLLQQNDTSSCWPSNHTPSGHTHTFK